MSAAGAGTGAGAVASATVSCTTIIYIDIEVSVASWGHLIFAHSPDVSVHLVEVLLLSTLPVVDHSVGLGNDVEDAIGLSLNVIDSLSFLVISTRFGFEDGAVVTDLFVGTETRLFVLGLTLLHNDVEMSSEAAVFAEVTFGCVLFGSMSGAVVTHVSEADIEFLLRFGFFLIIEVDFAVSSSRVADVVEIVAFHFRLVV